MKRTLIVLFLATLIAGCSSLSALVRPLRPLVRPVYSLFRPKVDVHSSPETLMTAYREYAKAGRAEKLWALYSDDLKAKTPEGLFTLEDSLRRAPVSEVHIGNPIVLSDSHALYFNIITFQNGDSIVERAQLVKQGSKWFIDSLAPNSE